MKKIISLALALALPFAMIATVDAQVKKTAKPATKMTHTMVKKVKHTPKMAKMSSVKKTSKMSSTHKMSKMKKPAMAKKS